MSVLSALVVAVVAAEAVTEAIGPVVAVAAVAGDGVQMAIPPRPH